MELAKFTANGERARPFFDVSYDLCIDVEALRDGDYFFGILGTDINLKTMAAVEDFIHLAPVGSALLCDDAEEGRNGEHIILDDTTVIAHEMKNFRLSTACAMDHTMDARSHLVEQATDDGSIGTSGRKDQTTDRQRCVSG